MIQKIGNEQKAGNEHIKILYPGAALGSTTDTGYYSIGRIDQAHISQGILIKMHPHANDDILSYFRTGSCKHTDSEGFSEIITPKKMMLMKAGKLFYHEEANLAELEGLQIFIRPREKDSAPIVIFEELNEYIKTNEWRLVASPDIEKTKLQLSSDTWIYDTEITTGTTMQLAREPEQDHHFLLYVFQGEAIVNGNIALKKGESVLITDENVKITTDSKAELVLFETNTKGPYYDGGMYSGNRM